MSPETIGKFMRKWIVAYIISYRYSPDLDGLDYFDKYYSEYIVERLFTSRHGSSSRLSCRVPYLNRIYLPPGSRKSSFIVTSPALHTSCFQLPAGEDSSLFDDFSMILGRHHATERELGHNLTLDSGT